MKMESFALYHPSEPARLIVSVGSKQTSGGRPTLLVAVAADAIDGLPIRDEPVLEVRLRHTHEALVAYRVVQVDNARPAYDDERLALGLGSETEPAPPVVDITLVQAPSVE